MKRYGFVGAVVYATISITDLVVLVVAVQRGVDLNALVNSLGIDASALLHATDAAASVPADAAGGGGASDDGGASSRIRDMLPSTGTMAPFLIAYGVHKLLFPMRVLGTVALTPPLVRLLASRGVRVGGKVP